MNRLRCWLCRIFVAVWQRTCFHLCDLRSLKRRPDGLVVATCLKCNKVLSGHYGLALPCKWTNSLHQKTIRTSKLLGGKDVA